MAELTKIFASNELFEAWKDNKEVPSNVIAVVLDETGEDVEKVAFGTNNIDGEYKTYEVAKGQEPTGTINITANGRVDVAQYATANVNVSVPTLPPVLSVTVTNPQGDNITVSPVYDGINNMPIGQDIYTGTSDNDYKYNYKIVTTGEIDLSKLKLCVYDYQDAEIASFPFTDATIQICVKDNVKYSVIDYSTTTTNLSCETVGITYDNVKYTSWVAL